MPAKKFPHFDIEATKPKVAALIAAGARNVDIERELNLAPHNLTKIINELGVNFLERRRIIAEKAKAEAATKGLLLTTTNTYDKGSPFTLREICKKGDAMFEAAAGEQRFQDHPGAKASPSLMVFDAQGQFLHREAR